MYRTQIYLEATQRKLLKALAVERHATLSELIREAIWHFVGQYRKPKVDSLAGIVGLYRSESDREGSLRHDDLYD
ncbi:MAG: hypothetical protein HYV03_05120 [Deltaproteobacteria bacterium]|nr:hypothetical protein [Deltaproteobacteria bacterium]